MEYTNTLKLLKLSEQTSKKGEKMIKGVFFDLFGTLMIYNNMQKAWERWLKALYENFKECGLKMPLKSFALKCDGFLAKTEPVIKNHKLTLYEKRIYSLGLELNLQLEIQGIREIVNKTIKSWQKYVPLDPDTIPVLEVLKKSKILALVTNFDHPPYVHSLLSELKLTNFFDSIIISSEVGFKKPNPMIFSFALKQTNLQPNEVCYIGDAKEDMEAAYSAKIYPILIKRKAHLAAELIEDYNLRHFSLNQNKLEEDIKCAKKIESLKELVELV